MRNLWVLWSFTQLVNVKDIYTSKSGNIVPPNKHAFNHKLFHIYNYAAITKVLQTCLSRLVSSSTDPFTELQLFDWITYTEAWTSTSLFSPWVPLSLYCVSCVCLCKLIYNFLLLFISNLKIASTWADWLTIKYCNNDVPNNLSSEINSTGLHCLIVDSSLLSDW